MPWPGDRHQVDPDVPRVGGVARQPLVGHPAEPVHLGLVNGLVRQPAGVAGAGLHLAHDEYVALAQQQVDLARRGAPVALEQHHPAPVRCRAASVSP